MINMTDFCIKRIASVFVLLLVALLLLPCGQHHHAHATAMMTATPCRQQCYVDSSAVWTAVLCG